VSPLTLLPPPAIAPAKDADEKFVPSKCKVPNEPVDDKLALMFPLAVMCESKDVFPPDGSIIKSPTVLISGVESTPKSKRVVPLLAKTRFPPATSIDISELQSIVNAPATSSSGVESKLNVNLVEAPSFIVI